MLLRFLETGEGRPVGSTRTIRANVRIIAATHRGVKKRGGAGTLRHDLFYRLRRVRLVVPPLRERPEDIPLLAEHFRRVINERHRQVGLAIEGIRPRAMAALQAYDWPGNVRELEAVLEEAMIFTRTGWLQPEDLGLPPCALNPEPAPGAPAPPAVEAVQELTWPHREALRIARDRGEVQRGDLIERCRISTEAARRVLVALVRLGLLRRVGGGRAVRYLARAVG